MLKRFEHDTVLELRLDHPPANALSPAIIAELLGAVRDGQDGGAEAMILSGIPGMFSAGLDVPAMLTLDEVGIRRTWDDYLELTRTLACSKLPVAAAITGHSPAGGAVLALFCDQRVMAEEGYRIGLNEVAVGLPVPPLVLAAVGRLVGPHQAERLCVRGLMLTGVEARAVGLVDRLMPTEEVVDRALAWCNELLELPRNAMAETRWEARRDLRDLFDFDAAETSERLTRRWFSDETQAVLRSLAERLRDHR